MRDDEHFEHIPWEHLSAPTSNRRWWIYAGAGALVVAAFTASLVRNSASTEQPTADIEQVTAPDATAMTSPVTTASVTTATSGVYSEADLMAFAPADLMAEAAAMAEWIASDFFTMDGTGAISSDLSLILPVDSSLPALEGHRSFVEWSSALEVEEVDSGRYRVLVVVRTLGASEGAEYRRLPPVGVWLDLQWHPDGWSLLDLPSPAELPATVQMPAWPLGDLPPAVSEAATAAGGSVLGGGQVGPHWRVVVEVTDDAGGRWPLVLWFDQSGTRIEVP